MIALTNCRLIDGLGGTPVDNHTVLVKENIIKALGPADQVPVPPSALVFNLEGLTLLPGLIDTHVHLCWGRSEEIRWRWGILHHLADSLPTVAYKAFQRARRTLQMGFTTLRDVGDFGYVTPALRDAINSNLVEGPRLVTSGQYLVTTAGHGNPLPPWLVRTDVAGNAADGPASVLEAVRRQVKMNTDWIKFCATGGLQGWDRQFNDEEIQVIVNEAHAKDRPVAAHCIRSEGTLAAVKAGVDTVEHGMELDDEIIQVMLDQDIRLIPTLFIVSDIMSDPGACGFTPADIEANRELMEGQLESFKRAWQAGVKIALGTDCGYNPASHGDNAKELAALVRNGLTPMDAILAATQWAAATLRLDDRVGTIEVDKAADILVVKGDPLTDITLFQKAENIALVIKDGVIYNNRLA